MLEAIALNLILTGYETRQWLVVSVATAVLIFDVVSDCLGIPT